LITTNRWTIFKEIALERDWQDKKHGSLEERCPGIMDWVEILEQELLEVKWAESREEKLEELLQVIAVGVACLEQHGVMRRKELSQRM